MCFFCGGKNVFEKVSCFCCEFCKYEYIGWQKEIRAAVWSRKNRRP